MKAKVRAVGKLQQMAEQQRDRLGQLFVQQRQQADYFQQQLEALGMLKSGCQWQSHVTPQGVNSTMLMNSTRVQGLLDRMLHHHQHEQALMEAECQRSRQQLEASQAKVKSLETVLERWKAKQQYEQARREQKQVEDLINARYRRKPL